MQRLLLVLLALVFWTIPRAFAQDSVADRAVAAAKEYVKSKNLKDPKLTILLSSLYNNSFPDFTKKWEALTGVKFEIVPLGYTDIPAKVMQEAVSKSGVYDIFNDFPYTMPDAAGAKVIIALDDLAKKYQPDFSGIADGLKFQQYYDGKLYVMINDGDHLLFVLRKDLKDAATIIKRFNSELRGMLADGSYNRLLGLNWVQGDAEGDGRVVGRRDGAHAMDARGVAQCRHRL